MNTFDSCELTIHSTNMSKAIHLASNTTLTDDIGLHQFELIDLPSGNQTFSIEYNGKDCNGQGLPRLIDVELEPGKQHYVYVGKMGAFSATARTEKSTDGVSEFSLS